MQSRSGQVHLVAVVAVGLVVLPAGVALAQSSNSSLGTWKLRSAVPNLVGADSPASVTLKYEAAGTGVKATLDVMGANGPLAHLEFSGDYDGKDNPVAGSGQAGVFVALTRLDANTVRLVHKRDGEVILTETAVVSSDGKTMTVTGTDAQGNPFGGVAVWDKQQAALPLCSHEWSGWDDESSLHDSPCWIVTRARQILPVTHASLRGWPASTPSAPTTP